MTAPLQAYYEIPLTQGQVALVDAADYPTVSAYKWFAHTPDGKTYYAIRNVQRPDGTRTNVRMHRFILGLNEGDERVVDHIDPSRTLDNRRKNLRVTTIQNNSRNRRLHKNNKCAMKGASKAQYGGWRSRICIGGKSIYIGTFDTAEAAHAAYCEAAKRYFGEFARNH